MSGFYGGPRGASFEIKKTYDSYSTLQKVSSMKEEGLQNGDWVMISCPPGKVIFGNYQASLWQVTSTVDYPYEEKYSTITGSDNKLILRPEGGLFGIKINKDPYLYFRLINSGFGSNTTTGSGDELIIFGGSSTEGINAKGETLNES